MLSDQESISLAEIETSSARPLVSGLGTMPGAVYDSVRQFVIYIARDPQNPAINQVFSASRRVTDVVQLTAHTEGSVSDLIWVAN